MSLLEVDLCCLPLAFITQNTSIQQMASDYLLSLGGRVGLVRQLIHPARCGQAEECHLEISPSIGAVVPFFLFRVAHIIL